MKFFIILFCSTCWAVSWAQSPASGADIATCLLDIIDDGQPIIIEDEVTMYLTTRSIAKVQINRDVSDQNQLLSLQSKPIVFIVHGWCQSSEKPWVSKLVQAWLKAVDCNVIVVDYHRLASYSYTIAATYVSLVGGYLCVFVNELKSYGILGYDITIAGHSLGAHVAGSAGSCIGDLGTIFALDAAGPIFALKPITERLDATDATWVSAIHTTMDMGIGIPIGNSDFYINSGTTSQCGCIPPTSDVTNPIEPFCSHTMSITLFINSLDETIKCKGIKGCSTSVALSASNVCVLPAVNPYKIISFPSCVSDVFGIYSNRIPGTFVVPTKYTAPHCFG